MNVVIQKKNIKEKPFFITAIFHVDGVKGSFSLHSGKMIIACNLPDKTKFPKLERELKSRLQKLGYGDFCRPQTDEEYREMNKHFNPDHASEIDKMSNEELYSFVRQQNAV